MALKRDLAKDGEKMTVTREDAQAIKALINSWRECQERISFHRRVPSPGSVRVTAKTARGQGRRKAVEFGPIGLTTECEPEDEPALAVE